MLCVCRLRTLRSKALTSVSRYETLLVSRRLGELLRVLKPNGVVAILEFSQPVGGLFRRLVAFIIGVYCRESADLSGSRGAYEDLPDSISKFPNQETLAAMMRTAGFEDVSLKFERRYRSTAYRPSQVAKI